MGAGDPGGADAEEEVKGSAKKRFPHSREELNELIDEQRKKRGQPLYAYKVRTMTDLQIKRKIPRLFYEGLLMSVDILSNEYLRSKDPKKKKLAAREFLDLLCDTNFIKNLVILKEEGKDDSKGKAEREKDRGTAEWGGKSEN